MAEKKIKAAEGEQVQAPESDQAEKKPEKIEVVVKTRFKDKACKKKLRRVGDVFKVTKERYDELVAAGNDNGVEYVAINAEEDEAE